MRFFKIVISRPADGAVAVPGWQGKPGFSFVRAQDVPNNALASLATYTSLMAGASTTTFGGANYAAGLVELDIVQSPHHTPGASSVIKVHGVSLAELSQSSNLAHLNVAVYAGMSKGLPLANPAQAGLLCAGQVLNAVGSWLGTDQWLALYIAAGGSSPSAAQTTGSPSTPSTLPLPSTVEHPANIVFTWQPGQPLIQALVNTLSVAYPQYSIRGQISSRLVNTGAPVAGFYSNLRQFAQDVHAHSLGIMSGYAPAGGYPGVWITLAANTFTIQDFSAPVRSTAINVQDVVGQSNWVAPNVVQVMTVMRGDLDVGTQIVLPGLTSTSTALYPGPAAPAQGGQAAQIKNSLVFSGRFLVQSLRHVGNSRGTDSASWISVADCLSWPTSASASSTSGPLPLLYNGQSTYSARLPM